MKHNESIFEVLSDMPNCLTFNGHNSQLTIQNFSDIQQYKIGLKFRPENDSEMTIINQSVNQKELKLVIEKGKFVLSYKNNEKYRIVTLLGIKCQNGYLIFLFLVRNCNFEFFFLELLCLMGQLLIISSHIFFLTFRFYF